MHCQSFRITYFQEPQLAVFFPLDTSSKEANPVQVQFSKTEFSEPDSQTSQVYELNWFRKGGRARCPNPKFIVCSQWILLGLAIKFGEEWPRGGGGITNPEQGDSSTQGAPSLKLSSRKKFCMGFGVHRTIPRPRCSKIIRLFTRGPSRLVEIGLNGAELQIPKQGASRELLFRECPIWVWECITPPLSPGCAKTSVHL